ncbi:hypothetical protein IQ07DRAFT_339710 [Pyrenochaeta sp. DS3sAY3a]|nr:hypothetical protein IQ07DRAFT_339710 [Pyrenochaeta sp. DS3sAY3a]
MEPNQYETMASPQKSTCSESTEVDDTFTQDVLQTRPSVPNEDTFFSERARSSSGEGIHTAAKNKGSNSKICARSSLLSRPNSTYALIGRETVLKKLRRLKKEMRRLELPVWRADKDGGCQARISITVRKHG